jgi:hypothetical protein
MYFSDGTKNRVFLISFEVRNRCQQTKHANYNVFILRVDVHYMNHLTLRTFFADKCYSEFEGRKNGGERKITVGLSTSNM